MPPAHANTDCGRHAPSRRGAGHVAPVPRGRPSPRSAGDHRAHKGRFFKRHDLLPVRWVRQGGPRLRNQPAPGEWRAGAAPPGWCSRRRNTLTRRNRVARRWRRGARAPPSHQARYCWRGVFGGTPTLTSHNVPRRPPATTGRPGQGASCACVATPAAPFGQLEALLDPGPQPYQAAVAAGGKSVTSSHRSACSGSQQASNVVQGAGLERCAGALPAGARLRGEAGQPAPAAPSPRRSGGQWPDHIQPPGPRLPSPAHREVFRYGSCPPPPRHKLPSCPAPRSTTRGVAGASM